MDENTDDDKDVDDTTVRNSHSTSRKRDNYIYSADNDYYDSQNK